MFNKSKIQMFIFLDEFLVTFILTLKDHRAQKMLSSPLKWLRVGRTCAPFLKKQEIKTTTSTVIIASFITYLL